MGPVTQYLQRMTEMITTEACKKANHPELYVSDVTKFILALDPVDRVLWIDSINKAEREAILDKERILEARILRHDLADGIASTMKTEEEARG